VAWTEVCISVPGASVASVEEALALAGALAITFEDEADTPVLEPEPGTTPLWPAVRIRGLFNQSVDRPRVLTILQDTSPEVRPDGVSWREIADRDWERAWMDRFRPMRFGRRLWIVPGGMSIPERSDGVEVRLDPGLAFGTGTHPTTALCLEWLDAQDVSGAAVVDYGCGSGILGIAAARLGARRVDCVDNDPQALEATRANASRNAVDDVIQCWHSDAFRPAGANLVLANILAAPLIRLAPLISACARPGGRIVLSGLLEEQAAEVVLAYESTCVKTGQVAREGWLRIDLEKRDA
jgi:ribosomal protein L11 methyltransferase